MSYVKFSHTEDIVDAHGQKNKEINWFRKCEASDEGAMPASEMNSLDNSSDNWDSVDQLIEE